MFGLPTRKTRRAAKRQAARDRRTLEASQNERLRRIRVRASYDAAEIGDRHSENHWANADARSANAANSQAVRRTLCYRSRYEVANNTYARGIVGTLANDVVGIGPTLAMQTKNADFNKQVEKAFTKWTQAVGLAAKLRTMKTAKTQDGEAVGLLVANPELPTRQKLDVVTVECDRLADPVALWDERNTADGIWYDAAGNPTKYRILRDHPGDSSFDVSLKYDDYRPAHVLHWFRVDRPEQRRGLPEIMPALPLFSQLRRFTLAVLGAAESLANIAYTIQTPGSTIDEDDSGVSEMETIELEARVATVMPTGYQLGQTKPEQPSTTYPEFKREIITEIARCLHIPYNIAACDSSDYNYASGRLDHQVYDRALDIERHHLGQVVLDRILHAWLQEFLVPFDGTNPSDIDVRLSNFPHQWFWVPRGHVDPQKNAMAVKVALETGQTSDPIEWAKRGLDHEVEMDRAGKALGLTLKEYQALLVRTRFPQAGGDSSAQSTEANRNGKQKRKASAASQATARGAVLAQPNGKRHSF